MGPLIRGMLHLREKANKSQNLDHDLRRLHTTLRENETTEPRNGAVTFSTLTWAPI